MAKPATNPATCEQTGYSDEECAFLKAVTAHQKRTRRKFLTFIEVLRLAKELGYRLPTEAAPAVTSSSPSAASVS